MTEREFNRHIDKMRPRLVGFAASFVNSGAATAEDMVQEAVIKVWGCRKQVENVDALMTVVLRNVCLDYLRLRKNRTADNIALAQCSSSVETASDPQKAMELQDQMQQIRFIMAKLPDDQQIVLRLRDVMGYEFPEIAQILDTTEGNVRTLLSRARKSVRDTMLKK